MKTLYVKYSNERNEKYRIKTSVIEDGSKRLIKKTPLSEKAENHVKMMYDSFLRLSDIYENTDVLINKGYFKDGSMFFEYLEGTTFENILDDYLENKDYEGLIKKIAEFSDIIKSSDKLVKFKPCDKFKSIFGETEFDGDYYAYEYSNIDLVFSNVIVNDKYNIVDYEWCFDFPVPLKYILFRAIDTYICLQEKRKILREKDIFSFLGYSENELELFREMERAFQKYAYSESFSSRMLYNNLHGNILDVRTAKTEDIPVRVYFDRGKGYSDNDSFTTYRKLNEINKLRVYISGADIIRIDPGCKTGVVFITDAYSVSDDGIDKVSCSSNGIKIEDRIFGFTDEDTQIYIYGFGKNDKYIEVEFVINLISAEYVKEFARISERKNIAVNKFLSLRESFNELKSNYEKLDEECSVLSADNRELEMKCESLNAIYTENINRLENEKAAAESNLELYKSNYEAILNSKFWRATKPFRKTVEGFRTIMNKVYRILRKPVTLVRCLRQYGVKETINIFKETYNIGVNNYLNIEPEEETANLPQNAVKTTYDIDRECRLKVSVIVPNYNHKEYLPKRLESIYNQTYKNFEVILLDDCSKDGSRELLAQYAEKYKDNTRYVPNETNSGGVFKQWAKGISLAEGDICWIAESDDFCDDDFLENLVYYFNDDAVMLAYAHYTFWMDGKPSGFAFEHYLNEVGPEAWSREYIRSAYDEVHNGLGIKNVIPNTSGCIFRKPVDMPLLNDEKWLNMKICGDWIFYLKQIVGGKIAYNPKANSYFRFHNDSASKVTHTRDVYYKEHGMVAETIAENYRDTKEVIEKNRDIIYKYYYQTMENPNDDDFNSLYQWDRIEKAVCNRKKTILISIYAFSLGGGEIFPIRLANELKRTGENVSVHIFEKDLCDDGVRNMLRSDIPVYYGKTPEEFAQILRENKFDIVNTHHQSIQHMVSEAYIKYRDAFEGCRHISTMHGMYEQLPKAYIMNHLKFIDDCTDIWTRVADKNLAPFYEAGIYDEKKHVFIPNGIQLPDKFDVKRSDYNIPEDAFVLGLASRALKEKGWLEAVEAVKKAREMSGKDIHIIMMGNGPMYDELKEQGVPDYVHLLGFVKESCKFYAICDMCLLPSYYSGESFPLTVIESLCVGKPVISSVIGETPRILNNSDGECAGRLFELVNGGVPVEKLAEIIAEFASDAEVYNKALENARTKSDDFTIATVAKLYLNVYNRLEDTNETK